MTLSDLLTHPVRIHVSATGSGAGLQNFLRAVPGCSEFFVGATFPYSHEEQESFLGFKPDRVCIETAMDMAMRSFMKACKNVGSKRPIGLGITTSVASLHPHRGDHRIHAAVVTDDTILMTTHILEKGSGEEARLRDGSITDGIGESILLMVAGSPQVKSHWYDWVTDVPYDLEDGAELARQRLFLHPLFAADGTRRACPDKSDGPNLVLYPGAFNPPHAGHFSNGKGATFHITANPPHKEPLSVQQMLRRAVLFQGHNLLLTEDDPLYLDKARRFPGCRFILGADAIIRMLDPKWGVEIEPLLQEFSALGTRFTICPRAVDGVLTRLEDVKIPEPFRHMFTGTTDTQFADYSSTRLREEMASHAG